MYLKTIRIVIFAVFLSTGIWAQRADTPLATLTLPDGESRSFTAQDLPKNVGSAWSQLSETLKSAKADLLELQINEILLYQEAAKSSVSKETLIENEVNQKVSDPDEASIKALYEANKKEIGNVSIAEVRPEIIKYLRVEREQAALGEYVKKIRGTAQIEYGSDIHAEKHSLNDVLVKINAEPITYAAYRNKNGLALYEYEANVFDQLETSLTMIVDATVYQAEAIGLGIPVNRLIEKEITSKMTKFSTDEQNRLESALRERLYAKYRVKYFVTEPKPFIQKVSTDDDPFKGKATAPVTIVVFADYECPACAAIHPLIKNLADKYNDRVRLVFRDFPLTKVHQNAFNAALAANAALKQGKFFEYSDLLYNNQESLDKNSLKQYAQELGLDLELFVRDMESEESASEVRTDIADGESYGVNGTPSIFVNGYKIRALSLHSFEKAVERALAGSL